MVSFSYKIHQRQFHQRVFQYNVPSQPGTVIPPLPSRRIFFVIPPSTVNFSSTPSVAEEESFSPLPARFILSIEVLLAVVYELIDYLLYQEISRLERVTRVFQ